MRSGFGYVRRDVWFVVAGGTLAIPFVMAGYRLLTLAQEEAGFGPQTGAGVACLVMAAALLMVPAARLAGTEPVEDEEEESAEGDAPVRFEKQGPGISCRVAELMVRQGQLDAAMEEYERISEQHPNEIGPYAGMLSLALTQLANPILASQIYARANGRLHRRELRHELWRRYRQLGAHLDLEKVFEESAQES